MMFGMDADRDASRAQFESRARRSRAARRRRDREAGSPIARARDLDDDRREIVASVGHELKTPLSIMLALCGRLEAGGRLAAEDAEDVARIRANAYTMLRRVQDLMLVARLESGNLQLEAADADVAAVVRHCVEGFRSVADQRGQALRIDAPESLVTVVDDEKLVSVVSNLVANAIRHAPPAGVVRCSVKARPGRLAIEVADSGPGVPADEREQIFERYDRGADASGTGLGLAIVQEIAKLHGGRVWVGEAPEGGALFAFELPLRQPRSSSPRRTRTLAVADRQKAIVEDLRAELAR
jgi:signal transduction histidine kinase